MLHPALLLALMAVPQGTETALAGRISEKRMQQTVRTLCAMGPRMGGTASNSASARWLADRFAKAGLETEIVEDEPIAFFETDPWTVEVAGEPLASAWPMRGSPSAAGSGRLSLEPLRGSVWLTNRLPEEKQTRGLVAVLYDGGSSRSGWPVLRGIRGEAHVPFFAISRQDGERLRKASRKGPEVVIDLKARTGRRSPRTVLATLPGRDRGHWLLFCAHGDADSGGPGADDNASGAAVVLEIAEVLAAAVADGSIPRPAYDIRFAVWGAEIASTRDYIKRLKESASGLRAVINYDQAGYGSGNDAIYFEPDNLEVNKALIGLLRATASAHLGKTGFPERFASNRALGGTDSYVFHGSRLDWDRTPASVTVFTSAFGSPRTVPVTPGYPPVNWGDRDKEGEVTIDGDDFYHSSGDTPGNTTDREPFCMGWCARIGALAALRFIESDAGD